MSAEHAIPAEVRQLIGQHISSVEQLEILLFLRERRDRSWSADDVAAALRGNATSARGRLAQLAASSFLSAASGSYRYGPSSDRLAQAVADLAECYARRRHAIVALIFAPRDDAAGGGPPWDA
jgi:hypothetical protein